MAGRPEREAGRRSRKSDREHAMSNEHRKLPLSLDQALDIYKMHQDKGWAVKQQMLASLGLLVPVIVGLIAYCFSSGDYRAHAGWAAFGISSFLLLIVYLTLRHASNDYVQSYSVIEYIRDSNFLPVGVLELIAGDQEREKSRYFPFVGRQFRIMAAIVAILVVGSMAIASSVTYHASAYSRLDRTTPSAPGDSLLDCMSLF